MSKNHTDLLIYIFQFSLFRYVLINYPIYFWNIQIVRYRTVVSNHLTFVCEYFPYKYITLADSHIMHALKFKRTKRVNKLIRLFIVVAVFFLFFGLLQINSKLFSPTNKNQSFYVDCSWISEPTSRLPGFCSFFSHTKIICILLNFLVCGYRKYKINQKKNAKQKHLQIIV